MITRNNPAPVFIARGDKIECLTSDSTPIGTSRNIRPAISEIALEGWTSIIMYTDGILQAGDRYGQELDICTLLEGLLEEQDPSSQEIADALLANAIKLDQGRPNDDMSVVVLRVLPFESDLIRRLTVRLPVIYNPPLL